MTPPTPPDPWIAAARGLAEAWPGVVTGDAPAVHRARVATRRLREALPVLDRDRRGLRRLRKDLRALTQALGPVRELDVTLGLVVRLLHDEPSLDTALETIRVRLMERRLRRRARLLRDVDSLDIAGMLARVRALSSHGSSKAAERQAPLDRPEIRRRMAARAIRLGRSVDRAGALYAPEALHAVRIAVKKLRYSLELGRAAQDRRRGARRDAAAAVFRTCSASGTTGRCCRRTPRACRVRRPSTTSTWRISRPWPLGSKTAADNCMPNS